MKEIFDQEINNIFCDFFSKLNKIEEDNDLSFRNKSFRKKTYKLLIAVSGGIDSVVLLDAINNFSEIYKESKINISGILHVDHGLRPNSVNDSIFVSNLSKTKNIPFFLLKVNPPPSYNNIENWGREVRYKFFSEKLNETSSDYILTAHHEQDLIETFLFRLITGRVNSFSLPVKEIDLNRKLLRPLFSITKEKIEAYAKINNIEYVIDETNLDQKYKRNFIRHSIMPLFKELNPNVNKSLLNYMTRNDENQNFFNQSCDSLIDNNKLSSRNYLISLPDIIATEAIRRKCALDYPELEPLISRNQFDFLVSELKREITTDKSFDIGFSLTVKLEKSSNNDILVSFFKN